MTAGRAGVAAVGAILLVACASPRTATDDASPVVRVRAKKFAFSPESIELRRGRPVVLEITSEDVVHGINLPDFGIREDVVPGRVARLRLVPSKAGTFRFQCDVFCGEGHDDMSGEIRVAP